MDKRLQVFVSSTFEDLREERAIIMKSLLQVDCIPAGMELFPAADEDSLSLIRSVIDDSDYYLIVLGGRYGSVHPEKGKSYTQLEYEYAVERGKPTIALLHGSPETLAANRTETTDEGRRLFHAFRAELRKKNCALWIDRSELTAAVLTSVLNLKKSRSAVGWVRANLPASNDLKDEVLRLRRELDVASAELMSLRQAQTDLASLAQGDDLVTMSFFKDSRTIDVNLTWTGIFRVVLPLGHGYGVSLDECATAIAGLCRAKSQYAIGAVDVKASASLGTVLNQTLALGLIEGTENARHYYRVTPHGAAVGSRIVAIPRGTSA